MYIYATLETQYIASLHDVYNIPVGHLTLLCSYQIEICEISKRQNKASINAYYVICQQTHPLRNMTYSQRRLTATKL